MIVKSVRIERERGVCAVVAEKKEEVKTTVREQYSKLNAGAVGEDG